ncbi:unnamed protein product [Dovyalis caffra]|uniref:Major facilitator superfamily (MFS) profile domain-containing protein n=1 Tax=Dovyalis caffra TaxID=77055 RepID=A0AAV1S6W3_9ROSI|nr:unnamed protein product [Dovyalis caffra]
MKGRTTDAQNILEKIAQVNQSKIPPGMLVCDSTVLLEEKSVPAESIPLLSSTWKKDLNFRSAFSPFVKLFSSKLIRITILVWELSFGHMFSYYGIILLTSELSSGQSKCGSTILQSENLQDNRLYVNVFITNLAELPSLLLSAITVDRIGRKLSIAFMFVLACIFLLPLVYHQSATLTTALLFGARMFSKGTHTVASIYASEIYPTAVRASGAGAASAAGRVGGMICPLVAVGLVTGCHLTEAIILFEVVMAISAMHGQNPVYTIDEALASVGFGKFQALLLAYAGLGWFAEAMEIMILSFVGPTVKSEWNLSPGQESLLTTAVFSGMLVEAYS